MTQTIDEKINTLEAGTVAVVGVPLDENSSFARGAALAPPRIRKALHSGSANLCSENGVDLSSERRWCDLGDLSLPDMPESFRFIETTFRALCARRVRVLALGGDHSITYPILRAYSEVHAGLNVLHFDAHPDLYDELDGNRYSHASPFARIMEERLVQRLVQVGIRTMNPHQREQAERFGVEVVAMQEWHPGVKWAFDGPLYVSFDIDCLDPACAPGVSHQEPGGLTTREVLRMVHALKGQLVGADLVEYNPRRDVKGMTAMVAAKLAKEFVAKLLQ